MKVALYARVSTEEQDTAGQVLRLKQWADLYHHQVAGVWEDYQSGKDDERKELAAMLGTKGYEAIVVTKLDRVMRSLIHLENLVRTLDARKVSLISIDEGIDTGAEGDDHSRRLVRQVLGAVAEWERRQIVSRVNEGLSRAKKYGTKSGKPIGRPRIPEAELTKEGARSRRRRRSNPPLDSLNIKGMKTGIGQSSSFDRVE